MTALTDCLNDIQNFMAANKLKLNPDKTEFILIGSKYSRKQIHSLFPTDILGNKVSSASNVKNLGVVFDPNLTLTDHISQVIKSTRFHIRDLYRIRHLLDLNTAILLANALVSSRIDYCNSLFASLTLSELKRLQSQSWGFTSRSTARVILGQVLRIATCGTRTHRGDSL